MPGRGSKLSGVAGVGALRGKATPAAIRWLDRYFPAEPGSDAGESYPANTRKFTFAIHNARLFFACLFLCLFVGVSQVWMCCGVHFY